MNKKTLYYVLLCVVPAVYGVLLAVVDFFAHELVVANVTIVGISGALVLWSCFIATTYILGKFLFEIGNDSIVLTFAAYLGSTEYNSVFAFFIHAGLVIASFMIPGSIVYWILVFWPWR